MSPSERTRARTRDEIFDDCRKFLDRLEEDHDLVFTLLTGYEVTIDEFLNLRRCVWSDSKFYHPELSEYRMHIAVAMICQPHITEAKPAMCRSVLGLDNGTAQERLDSCLRTRLGHTFYHGYTFFHGLASNIGIDNPREIAGEWHILARDVFKRLGDISHLIQPGTRQYIHTEWRILTPLLMLISYSISTLIFRSRQHAGIKATNSAAVLAICEEPIFAWLSDLYNAGVDLALYGRNEKRHFRDPKLLPYGLTQSYHSLKNTKYLLADMRYEVRLIGFRYGRLPTDWKFYWSEPSDQFAGDFWHLVDMASQEKVMNIPGAWID